MSFDRDFWVGKFKEAKWEDVLKATRVSFKKDRGGKCLSYNEECYKCLFLDGVVFYPDKTFRCRYSWCGNRGEIVDYVINYLENSAVGIYDCLEDKDLREFFDSLPKIPDPRQMRFFWSKKWSSEWAYHF